MQIRTSAIVLIVANCVPLVGVLFLDWRVFDVLMLYWIENVIIGVVNVMRMATCQQGFIGGPLVLAMQKANPQQQKTLDQMGRAARWIIIPFFIVHYGMFCFGHLTAITSLFADDTARAAIRGFSLADFDVAESPLLVGALAIAASHIYSFVSNYLGNGENQRTNLMQLMMRPYGRIVALHIAVIIGAGLVILLDSPVYMLVILVAAKIAMDLRMHLAERSLFAVPV